MGGRSSGSGMTSGTSGGVGNDGAQRAFGPNFGRKDATDFMDSHNASQFSTEQYSPITVGGVEFNPFSYSTSGGRVINTYQASVPSANGEYALFQTVVTRNNYKDGTVYRWDRSSIGTKFD